VVLSTSARAQEAGVPASAPAFNKEQDLISLHYDHAPDKDDGQSAAADRTVLQSLFDCQWITEHTVAVSGAYGLNKMQFVPQSDAVMDAVFNNCGGWVAAAKNWDAAVEQVFVRWAKVLNNGGNIWVKEGGQSDLTAAVIHRIKKEMPRVVTTERIHVVQHSKWNEDQTTPDALAYTKKETNYIRISDGNKYLRKEGFDKDFVKAAENNPQLGEAWKAAFQYYNPKKRIDFSDTCELLHMLGIGKISIAEFQHRFLSPKSAATTSPATSNVTQ